MTWVKLDDQFFRKPKSREVGLPGRSLFLVGLCYCASNLTDGVIPKVALPVLMAEAEVSKGVVAKLVGVGWWEDRGDFFFVPDYLEFNPSRADVEGRRDAALIRTKNARSSADVRANTAGSTKEVHPPRTRTPKRQRAKGDEKYADDFAAVWECYPRKLARADAFRAYSARRNAGDSAEDLALAAKHYAEECAREHREEKFVLHGATFFGPRERWKDYLEPPAPGQNEQERALGWDPSELRR